MTGCVQWNLLYNWKLLPRVGLETGTVRSVDQCLAYPTYINIKNVFSILMSSTKRTLITIHFCQKYNAEEINRFLRRINNSQELLVLLQILQKQLMSVLQKASELKKMSLKTV